MKIISKFICLLIIKSTICTQGQEILFQRFDDIGNNSTFNLTCPSESTTFLIVSNTSEANLRKLNELAFQISDSESVEALLDLVRWKSFVYSCQQACNNSEITFDSFCSNVTTCCISESREKISIFTPDCRSVSCTDFTDSFLITKWYIFLIWGLLCLFGNLVVIYDKIKSLSKQKNKGKEVQIYNVLVLNLASADFLMGVYLFAISLEIKHKVAERLFFSEPMLCNALGIINSISVQVSITILLIISIYRLLGVVLPYKNLHVTVVTALVVITWLTWLVIAILPVIPLESLTTTFTFGLVRERMLEQDTIIDFLYLTPFFQDILDSITWSNDSEISLVLPAIVQYPSTSVLEKAVDVLGFIDIETENWSLVGYYDIQYACATNFFVTHEDNRLFNYFTIVFVSYNFIASIAMLIAYVMVTCKISDNDVMSHLCNCCVTGKELIRKNTMARGPHRMISYRENKKLYRRISIILLTNLLCWLPLCTAAIVEKFITATYNISMLLDRILSIQTAMLLVVPLNSILNPYIYSIHLWKRLFTKMKTKAASYGSESTTH